MSGRWDGRAALASPGFSMRSGSPGPSPQTVYDSRSMYGMGSPGTVRGGRREDAGRSPPYEEAAHRVVPAGVEETGSPALARLLASMETYHHFQAPKHPDGAALAAARTETCNGELVVLSVRTTPPDEAGAAPSRSKLTLDPDEAAEAGDLLSRVIPDTPMMSILRGVSVTIDAFAPHARPGMPRLRSTGPLPLAHAVFLLTDMTPRHIPLADGPEGHEFDEDGEEGRREGKRDGKSVVVAQPDTSPVILDAIDLLQDVATAKGARTAEEVCVELASAPEGTYPAPAKVEVPTGGWEYAQAIHARLRATPSGAARVSVVRDPRSEWRTARNLTPGPMTDFGGRFPGRMRACAEASIGSIVDETGRPIDVPATASPGSGGGAGGGGKWFMHELAGPDGTRYRFLLVGEGKDGSLTPPGTKHLHRIERSVARASGNDAVVAADTRGARDEGTVGRDMRWRAYLRVDSIDLVHRHTATKQPVWLSSILLTRDATLRAAVLLWVEAHPGLCLTRSDVQALRTAVRRAAREDLPPPGGLAFGSPRDDAGSLTHADGDGRGRGGSIEGGDGHEGDGDFGDIERYRTRIAELERRLDRERLAARQMQSDLQSRVVKLQHELRDARERGYGAEDDVDPEEKEAAERERAAEEARLREQVASLQRKLSEKRVTATASSKSREADLERERDDLLERVHALSAEMEARVTELSTELEKVKAQAAESEARVEDLQAEHDREAREARRDMDDLRTEYERRLRAAERAKAEADRGRKAAETHLASAQTEIERAHQDAREAKEAVILLRAGNLDVGAAPPAADKASGAKTKEKGPQPLSIDISGHQSTPELPTPAAIKVRRAAKRAALVSDAVVAAREGRLVPARDWARDILLGIPEKK